jgi:hypothetical protein
MACCLGGGGSQIVGSRNAITPLALEFFLVLVGFAFLYRGDRLAQQVDGLLRRRFIEF